MSESKRLPRRLALRTLGAWLALPAVAWAQQEPNELDRLRARGTLKVAVYKDNAPFSDGPGQAMTGLDVSLAEALAARLGLRLELLPFDAGENMGDDLRNMVWRGHYLGYGPADVMLHVPVDRYLIQKTPQALIFAPYLREAPVLLHDTRRLPEVRVPEDLQGQPLAAERGAGLASALMGYRGGLLRQQVGIHASGVAAARAVIEGQAAAAYVTRAQAEGALALTTARPAHLQMADIGLGYLPERGWPVGMAIKAEHAALGRALEQALRELHASGEMLALFRRHGLTLAAP